MANVARRLEIHDQPVSGISGASIFWSLVSITFSTMVQPSVCMHILDEAASHSALTFCRSSPFVCLIDAVVDIKISVQALRRTTLGTRASNRTVTGSRSDAYMKAIAYLAVLVLGLLPPALKIFGAGGIPGSQLLCAIYVSSAVASAVRTVVTGNSLQLLDDVAESWHAQVERPSQTATDTTLFTMLIMWPHNIFLMFVWARIGDHVHLQIHSEVAAAIDVVFYSLGLGLLMYFIQHVCSIVVRGRWFLPRLPMVLGYATMYLLALIDELTKPKNTKRTSSSNFQYVGMGHFYVWHVWLCSLALASLLHFLAGRVSTMLVRTGNLGTEDRVASTEPEDGQTPDHLTCPLDIDNQDHIESYAAGDIGLSILSESSQPTTAYDDVQPVAAEASVSAPKLSTPRLRLKTEAEAKAECYRASRALHSIVFPETEDPIRWEKRVSRLAEEGRTPYAEPRSPSEHPSPFWVRILVYILWYWMVLVWRLCLSVWLTYAYVKAWPSVKSMPWRQNAGWLAFGILNIFTAATYYFISFSTEGTKSSTWTQSLG